VPHEANFQRRLRANPRLARVAMTAGAGKSDRHCAVTVAA
jgi:hypothetical protein